MTWNSQLFPDNATNTVELTYITADQQLVWYSPNVANKQGYANVYMDKGWLLGASGNDTTLGIYSDLIKVFCIMTPCIIIHGLRPRGHSIRQLVSFSRMPLRWTADSEKGQNLTFSLISYVCSRDRPPNGKPSLIVNADWEISI